MPAADNILFVRLTPPFASFWVKHLIRSVVILLCQADLKEVDQVCIVDILPCLSEFVLFERKINWRANSNCEFDTTAER